MDIVAHGAWAGLGVAFACRRRPIPARTVAAVVALAVLPDLAQLLPLVGLAASRGDFHVLHAYATATPGSEPLLPPAVAFWSHHLHCVLHSAVAAAVVTALSWALMRTLWLPLLGWWSHVVIDVFTHSAEFYPSPVLYPFTYWGFDGVAWNAPWFMALNYGAIAAALVLWRVARRRAGRVDRHQDVA
jgi:hypothetical protein